ncbi:MAG TPA: hypothetical protein V6C89_18805 [Drouetiella sp.]|jgi:hypothetical protein
MAHDKPGEKFDSTEQRNLNAAAAEANARLTQEVQQTPQVVARTNDGVASTDKILVADNSSDAKYADVQQYAKYTDTVGRMPAHDQFNIGTQANVRDVLTQFKDMYPNNYAFNQSVNDVLRV